MYSLCLLQGRRVLEAWPLSLIRHHCPLCPYTFPRDALHPGTSNPWGVLSGALGLVLALSIGKGSPALHCQSVLGTVI